jgi:tetratricopeptide (TPR) repeat protein
MNHRERQAAGDSATTDLKTATATASLAALCEAGLAHMRAGRHLEAQLCCEQALALDGDHADTLHLLGCLALKAKQYDHAVEWISRAIRREPKPSYLTSLGTTLLHQGRREDALQVFDKAVQLAPGDADLWRDLGNALVEVERTTDAILSFQQALKLDPRHWDAAHKAALLLFGAERFEDALCEFARCDELQGGHFPTLYMRAMMLANKALALGELRRIDEAFTTTAGRLRSIRIMALQRGIWLCCGSSRETTKPALRDAKRAGRFRRSRPTIQNSRNRCGWEPSQLPARQCFCLPRKDWATPSSSRAMCRSWRRRARA